MFGSGTRKRALPAAAAVISGLAILSGCAVKQPVSAPEHAAPRPRGVTGVTFVPDPEAARSEIPPGAEIIPPAVVLWPMPLYPPEALDRGCGDGAVGLRIVVGVTGNVESISGSPLVRTTEGDCGARFRAASEDALRNWRFRPAEWRRMEQGDDVDGDGVPDFQRVIESRKIPVYLDLRIDFEVDGGEGRVRIET
ncbi:MAG TPA: hypothetical protein VNI57_12635 [Candidatus Saccharimonadales bacterium]|nr:hypothetical protein [Candidatus Saccharimonadales bacterium]